MEHTELPWKQSKNIVLVDGYPGYLARCIVWDNDTGTANANAGFIVTACNEHDTLKAKAGLLTPEILLSIEVLHDSYNAITDDLGMEDAYGDIVTFLSKAKALK